MKKWRAFKKICRYFGFAGLPAAFKQLTSSDESLECVRSPHIGHSVYFRLNTTDVSIYWQIFVNREYDFPVGEQPALIVDAGANVGYSAIYYARRFPDSKIIALEPEPSNFQVLLKNVASYPNVIPLQKALWHTAEKLTFFAPPAGRAGAQKDGFHVALGGEPKSSTFEVECTTIPDILSDFCANRVDILKIDVEGAEKEIFAHATDWIADVDVIIAEMHDRIIPGCTRSFYAATASFVSELHKGENIVVSRHPFTA